MECYVNCLMVPWRLKITFMFDYWLQVTLASSLAEYRSKKKCLVFQFQFCHKSLNRVVLQHSTVSFVVESYSPTYDSYSSH